MATVVASSNVRSVKVTAVKRTPPPSCPRCSSTGAFVEYHDSRAHCKFCANDIDKFVGRVPLGTLGYWHRNPFRRWAFALLRALGRAQ